jgi:4-amino-4-deoxy-L-arabinose transferase-like glycosyltransferase
LKPPLLNRTKNISEKYFIFFALIIFILARVNYLSLPYYWDEAWSYSRAVISMSQNGLTLFPGNTDTELTRGHPLMFYFLSALWMKIFGSGLVANHIFPLLISVLTVYFFYVFCKKMFNFRTAVLSVVLLLCQQCFLAQSTMMLPEIFLTLLSLISVYTYFKKQWVVFVISTTMMVLTKETGIVLASMFIFDHFILSLFYKDHNKQKYIFSLKTVYILIPFLFFGFFLALQKQQNGWFFLPDHLAMVKTSFYDIIISFRKYSLILVFDNGRYLLFIAGIVALILCFKKIRLDPAHSRLLAFIFSFILFYLIFSSINFFTTRYLLSILPFFIVACAYILLELVDKNTLTAFIMSFILFCSALCYTLFSEKNESDVSLAYRDSVQLHKEVVTYCENNKWQEKNICTNVLMMCNLKEPLLGYTNKDSDVFSDVLLLPDSTTDIVIVCSNDILKFYRDIQSDTGYMLAGRFEKNVAWVEIYRKK